MEHGKEHEPGRFALAMETDSDRKGREYRSAKALPFELRQHCAIYFEEKLCSST